MLNLKDAKEVKMKVEEIKSKRKPSKKVKNKKPLTKKQKEIKNKFRKFLVKLVLVEYIICAGILLVCNQIALIKDNQSKDELIKIQQQTLIKVLNSQDNTRQTKNNVEGINYITTDLKAVKNESRVYLGNFKITHYCACTKCCGKNAQGITASGKVVEENKTIAVDPSVIKLGSKVYIDGYGYMEAQDTGSAIKGNIIDVYVADHQEALNLGVVYKDVWLVK